MFLPALGSTELGRIIAASGGLVDGTTLQILTNGFHTMRETASIASCDALFAYCDVARIRRYRNAETCARSPEWMISFDPFLGKMRRRNGHRLGEPI